MQIKLSFLGAARNVTGSRYLVEFNGTKVLIDCGLYQERDLRARNWDAFPTPAKDLDAVLLTHAHLDHCGLLPKLVREGFRGKIHCTPATSDITRIVLFDSAHLQEEDAAFKRKRHQREGRTGPRPVVPLYTTDDVETCLPHFSSDRYDTPVRLGDGVQATFHDAGHILGSAMIKMTLNTNGEQRTVVFSGDVGRWDKPILNDPTVFEQADYVLTESTYGDRVHEDDEAMDCTLCDVINDAKKTGGNVIIPSFAVERAQEVLYRLNTLLMAGRIPHLPVFLDSPMAVRVTEVFENHPEIVDDDMKELLRNNHSPFELPGLQMTPTTKQSKAINDMTGPMIVIAGSGMCTGGRVKHHLVRNITRPECTILFVGYQAAGTLGRHIVNGAEEVRILGQAYPVRARIARAHGFSAHADRDELFRWVHGLKHPPRHVFVTHGEDQAAHAYADFLKNKTGWPISVPQYLDSVKLD